MKKTVSFAFLGVTGRIHIGHMRNAVIADFISRVERTRGKEVFFPFGVHATGRGPGMLLNRLRSGEEDITSFFRDNQREIPKGELELIESFKEILRENMLKFGVSPNQSSSFATTDPDFEEFVRWTLDLVNQRGGIVEAGYFTPHCLDCGPISVDPSETDISEGGKAVVKEENILSTHFKGIKFITLDPGETLFLRRGKIAYSRRLKLEGILPGDEEEMEVEMPLVGWEKDRIKCFTKKVVCKCSKLVFLKEKEKQLFINYSDPEWRRAALRTLEGIKVFPESKMETLKSNVLNYPQRAFLRDSEKGYTGVKYMGGVIEAISDSTVYQYFYILKELQARGLIKGPLDRGVFEEAFFGGQKSNIHQEFLNYLPLEINISGKEHLDVHFPVMILTNSLIFGDLPQPREFILLEYVVGEKFEKISKSKGNVYPLEKLNRSEALLLRIFLLQEANPDQEISWKNQILQQYRKHIVDIKRWLELIAKNVQKEAPETEALWGELKSLFIQNFERRRIRETTDLILFKCRAKLALFSGIWGITPRVMEEYSRIFDCILPNPKCGEVEETLIDFEERGEDMLSISEYLSELISKINSIHSPEIEVRYLPHDECLKVFQKNNLELRKNKYASKMTNLKIEKEILEKAIFFIQSETGKKISLVEAPSSRYFFPQVVARVGGNSSSDFYS